MARTSPYASRAGRQAASRGADAASKLPVCSVLPAITGDLYQGETLTCSEGTWSNTPDAFAYQWHRDGVSIANAIAATHELVLADVGCAMSCTVVATNLGVPAVATSAATEAVLGDPTFSVDPSISGTAQQGETLTGDSGTHTGTSETLRWLADEVAIVGETAATLVLAAGQIGAAITFEVTAINAAGSTVATSAATEAVIAATVPVNTVLPSISGTAQVGQTLTAADGTWTGAPTPVLTRQWLADATPISGATGATYLVDIADLNKVITVTVTGTNAHSAVDATSAATAAVIAA